MADAKRVLMLIGVYRSDWEDERFNASVVPVVAGCVDETVWSHETDEETNARWVKCKGAYDPSGMDYEWREVWVTLDPAGLRVPFEVKTLVAQIEAAGPSTVALPPVDEFDAAE